MKKNKFKRALSIALATVMMVGTITSTPQGASEVQAATAAVKDVNLGTAGLANTGSKVYFGLDTSSTITKVNGTDNTETAGGTYTKTSSNNLWRVLDANKGLLFADDNIAQRRYDAGSNDWATSELYSWLNGTNYKTNNSKFSALEQGAIATNSDGDMRLLTIDEVKNTSYGFSNDENTNTDRAASNWWWLRSPGSKDNNAAIVYPEGNVGSNIVTNYVGSVRPAFNLSLSSVLFSSASSVSKSSFASVGDANVAGTWKLTLKDGNEGFTATRTDAGDLTAGTTVKVNVSSLGTAGSGVTYDTISGMLTDADGTVLCYGKATEEFGTGTGDYTFTIPEGVTGGARFYVFAEKVNAATLTDYASNMVEPVYSAPVTYSVTITNPADSHITLSAVTGNGIEIQTGLTGAMTAVVYTADDGYYFPADYEVTGSNSITVTRNSSTQITVSGTPTADAGITLVGASEKGSQAAPSVTDGVGKIAGTTTAMEYASSEDAATWTSCDDGNTTVAAGTWYVRYAATDEKKAGTATSVVVTSEEPTPTPEEPTPTPEEPTPTISETPTPTPEEPTPTTSETPTPTPTISETPTPTPTPAEPTPTISETPTPTPEEPTPTISETPPPTPTTPVPATPVPTTPVPTTPVPTTPVPTTPEPTTPVPTTPVPTDPIPEPTEPSAPIYSIISGAAGCQTANYNRV